MKTRYLCDIARRLPPWAVDANSSCRGLTPLERCVFQRIPTQDRCPGCTWEEYFYQVELLSKHGPGPNDIHVAVSGAPRRPPYLMPLYFRRYDGHSYLAGVSYSSNVRESRHEDRERDTRLWVADQARYRWDTGPEADVIWTTSNGGWRDRGPLVDFPPPGRLRTNAADLAAGDTKATLAPSAIGQGGRRPGVRNFS
ncbi:hypothetical protein BV20DRAFT_970870 [Pilatotrama ljubarskyi]|nr:hypothetical protein BV20DRAFT_970870 [Pilatotrama ljubarskyi]